MSQKFLGWDAVSKNLVTLANNADIQLNLGQRASLRAIAERVPHNGLIIADEVGMGKTRIAAAVARSVVAAGGRVAILVPPGLGFQWSDELKGLDVTTPRILRSLWQYLQAWESADSSQHRPWFNEQALLVSHAFTNWRLGGSSDSWRWALLPELYAQWRKQRDGRLPRDYCGNERLKDPWVKYAAKSICAGIEEGGVAAAWIQALAEHTPWPTVLEAEKYARDASLRPWLETAVGLGLGIFDLVIIDEAHKSRGQESGLNRLVERMVLQAPGSRRLAMTATPVELDGEQWRQMLGRIQVDAVGAHEAIKAYSEAVLRVRQCPSNVCAQEAYKQAARAFHRGLRPYLLRRDKREDPYVQKFAQLAQKSMHAYRRETEILIETHTLPATWKQTVCAAEALSFVTRHADDPVAKRLRLTLGNGHGIAAMVDETQQVPESGVEELRSDLPSTREATEKDAPQGAASKRLERARWWRTVMAKPFEAGDSALFDHPAILVAVAEIERICQRGEKVLVFGRFTRPLQALVGLLNGREMLRSLDSGQPWPQSKVHEKEWPAVEAAHRQLRRPGSFTHAAIDEALGEQYKRLEQQRRQFRETFIRRLERGFDEGQMAKRERAIFNAFRNAATAPERDMDTGDHPLAIVAKATQELLEPNAVACGPGELASAFVELVNAASDRDEGDADGDGELNEGEATGLWNSLEARLNEEYNGPQGGFARLMFGETTQATRRLLQLAFNRPHGYPKVLVAQSVVGREGLNLHKACRTVVLLHPEWNPGVVEQQIGRVDRIGSLWERKLDEAIAMNFPPEAMPHIEVRPVVFQGTYDEANWQVLRARWDNLRAQLHGIVISPRVAESYVGAEWVIAEINASAPNFSPSHIDKECDVGQGSDHDESKMMMATPLGDSN